MSYDVNISKFMKNTFKNVVKINFNLNKNILLLNSYNEIKTDELYF